MNTPTYFKILKSTLEYNPTYFTFWKYVFIKLYKYAKVLFVA